MVLPGRPSVGTRMVVRAGSDSKTTSGGAQVAAEAMPYDRARRTDCNTVVRPPGMVPERLHAHPRAVGEILIGQAPSDPGSTYRLVEYRVRAARITDVERLVALSGDRLGGRAPGPLDAADILRQLVFLPHASVFVAEKRREISGGAVLAIRPSVRAGGYVGTIDLLVVDPDSDVDEVTGLLVEEAVRSASNKGCTSVEAPQPESPAERARWERLGFSKQQARLARSVAPAGGAGRRNQ
jgi:hypothetical protein